ncbi:MAG: hypothetical protein A2Z99_19845 [Treponema sp. GWB1_62_6]|nr:MAG: hypothetical protein A2001_10065 [Treponema sp. GWC1_61_84]OHE71184.1 MAG: hypothetical protein A2Z99_19845 [Treponema sp. GWB1_62_6]
MRSPRLSLEDLAGREYLDAVCRAASFIFGSSYGELRDASVRKVDFYPRGLQERLDALLQETGHVVAAGLDGHVPGAPTSSFASAFKAKAAPLAALGFFRVGEDGKLYLISKSEHYHASLGHNIPAFGLLEIARSLGITNATHNNTRGHLVRLLERELVRVVNGIGAGDGAALDAAIAAQDGRVLNRVINLQSGSVAVEAAVKMMLARFYRLEAHSPAPKYEGRIPVFLVMGDGQGGRQANYHGTSITTQTFRGLWPELNSTVEASGAYRVRTVRINDLDDFSRVLAEEEKDGRKVAGFIHEIILMNYGGIKLEPEYLKGAYRLAHAADVPVCVDEIQSCLWYEGLFLFKEYGLDPDFVSVGKGFSGGLYAASRIITTPAMDDLNQFGALVTNGQEELAALSYLITMRLASENEEYIRKIGEYYEAELRKLAASNDRTILRIEGSRHLSAVFFRTSEDAIRFCSILSSGGIDISAQNYKADCPPSALTKLPLTTSRAMVDLIIRRMAEALELMGRGIAGDGIAGDRPE